MRRILDCREDSSMSDRHRRSRAAQEKASDQIERWLAGEGDKTLGGLIDVFEEKSFALIFILLLGVPALALPTGGATHVFEIIAMLAALQLVAGRAKIWAPRGGGHVRS